MPTIQSVIFPKDQWSLQKARSWLKSHKYKKMEVDVKPNTYRFRQKPPTKGVKYYTVKLNNGIGLIIHN